MYKNNHREFGVMNFMLATLVSDSKQQLHYRLIGSLKVTLICVATVTWPSMLRHDWPRVRELSAERFSIYLLGKFGVLYSVHSARGWWKFSNVPRELTSVYNYVVHKCNWYWRSCKHFWRLCCACCSTSLLSSALYGVCQSVCRVMQLSFYGFWCSITWRHSFTITVLARIEPLCFNKEVIDARALETGGRVNDSATCLLPSVAVRTATKGVGA